ncbi:MAG: hypothetical protein KGJ02_08500 [Verrucomicrobiota bacterium]|nr:hypothetical protein [Verrucomicrobiota bacterium]
MSHHPNHISSALPLPRPPAPEKLVYNWEICAKAIAQVAFQILIPFAVCLLIYAALPLAVSAVLLPAAALGATFSTLFLFLGKTAFPEDPDTRLPPLNLRTSYPNL